MSVRLVRPINVFWESVLAAVVLLVGVPLLMAGGVYFLTGLAEVLGRGAPIAPLTWVIIWALVTGGTLLTGITITTGRLYAGRAQPHHREYRDFTLMRHARHGPLLTPKRSEIDGLEVVSFGIHYLLSARVVPAWWPVVRPQDGADFATYRHPVFLCILPCQVPPLTVWSKTRRWDSSIADRIIRGERCDVSAELNEHFDIFGRPDAAALFTDKRLQNLMLDGAGWSIEVRGDRLLAYQIPPRQSNGNPGSCGALPDGSDLRFVAELAQQIHRAHKPR